VLSKLWKCFWRACGYRRCCLCNKLKLQDRFHAGGRVNIHGRADDPVCKLCMLERGQELDDYNAAATQYLRNMR
jgi:hypothetical protein